MATIPKKKAMERIADRIGGTIVSDYEYTIYVDADCHHCGSRYKVGELDVEDGQVSVEALENLIEEYENR